MRSVPLRKPFRTRFFQAGKPTSLESYSLGRLGSSDGSHAENALVALTKNLSDSIPRGGLEANLPRIMRSRGLGRRLLESTARRCPPLGGLVSCSIQFHFQISHNEWLGKKNLKTFEQIIFMAKTWRTNLQNMATICPTHV